VTGYIWGNLFLTRWRSLQIAARSRLATSASLRSAISRHRWTSAAGSRRRASPSCLVSPMRRMISRTSHGRDDAVVGDLQTASTGGVSRRRSPQPGSRRNTFRLVARRHCLTGPAQSSARRFADIDGLAGRLRLCQSARSAPTTGPPPVAAFSEPCGALSTPLRFISRREDLVWKIEGLRPRHARLPRTCHMSAAEARSRRPCCPDGDAIALA
jgi:hypothetical protein